MTVVRSAIVLATSPGALEVVGGLPLAARTVLALRAAGVGDLAVLAPGGAEPVRRALARRGVAVRWLATAEDALEPTGPAPLLLVAGPLLVAGDVLTPLLAAGPGLLRVAPGPEGVVAATCPRPALAAWLAGLAPGRLSLGEAAERAGLSLGPEVPRGPGLLLVLSPVCPRAALEQALLEHLAHRTTVGDSYLAALIDRRLSRPITRLLLGWPVTPSQVTVASVLVGVAGAIGLATLSYAGRLVGLLGLVASTVLDCVDGELARARCEQSAAGARLDVIGDYTVHAATFAGLAIGLARQGLPPAGTWAALALVTGVGAAMATVHHLFIRPALTRGGDLHWTGDEASLHGSPVATVVERLASRDYTYLLLAFALLGHLEWFLYAAAVGSWVFVAGLVGYRGIVAAGRRRRAPVPSSPVPPPTSP